MSTSPKPAMNVAVAAIALLLAAVLFAYRDTGAAMVAIWARSESFTHAFLVPPISLWLIWRQREELALQPVRPVPWMLVPIACVSALWLLGDLAWINALTQFALVATIVLAVPALLGIAVARTIFFPLCFLFFAVPVGEFLMPQFISWTADFTVAALRLSGIPVFREGEQFIIPSGNWSVVEACSGIRYLMSSVMVGTLFAYLNFRSYRRRAIFIGVSILLPIVANWVRAYLIVLLGHLSNNRLAAGADHLIYGWVFFGVVVSIMFFIGMRWSEPDAQRTESAPRAAAATIAPSGNGGLFAVFAAVAFVVLLPHLAIARLDKQAIAASPKLDLADSLAGGWSLRPAPLVDWKPAFQEPSAALQKSYASNDGEVGIYLGYYAGQTYGRKLVSSTNVLVKSDNPEWSRVATGSRSLALGNVQSTNLRPVDVQATVLRTPPGAGNRRRLLVWQMYWAHDRLTASDPVARTQIAVSRLLGRGDAAAVVLIYTTAEPDSAAEFALESFLRSNLGQIESQLRLATQSQMAGP